MKRLVVIVVAVAVLVSGVQAQDQARLFKVAVNTEMVDGDLRAAIEQYKKVAAGSDRALAAQALLRMAECYQKLGDPQARAVYERVVRDFADQESSVAAARVRLGRLRQAGSVTARSVFCEGCGDDLADGSISRDGRWMAVTDWDTGDIVLREVSSGRTTRLHAKAGSFRDWQPDSQATPPGDSDHYAFKALLSPDAERVAYTWDISGLSSRGRDFAAELRIKAREGGSPRTLVENPEFEWSRAVAWSHDGQRLLTVLRRPDKTWQLAWVSTDSAQITLLRSLDWRLGNGGGEFSLSPDGRFIAYSALAVNPAKPPPAPPESTAQHLYVLAADGSSETELTRTNGVDDRPLWTKDGRMIVFRSDRAQSHDLWAVPVQDGRAAGVPSLVSRGIGWPAAVLDTGVLLTLESTPPVSQVVVAAIATSGQLPAPARITHTLAGAGPSFSPDAKTLQFTRGSGGFAPGGSNFDIVLHSLDTGTEEIITRFGFRRPVEWLRDGSAFLTVSRSAGSAAPTETAAATHYAIDPRTGASREVARASSPVVAPSPDGRTLFQFGRDPARPQLANRLVAVDVDTGHERVLRVLHDEVGGLPPMNRGVDLALSPDGRTLASLTCSRIVVGAFRSGVGQVLRSGGDCRLSIVDVDGTRHRELVGPFKGITAGNKLAWTPDGRAILFASHEGADGECGQQSCSFRLMRISRDGATPEHTGLEMNLTAEGVFSVSADGTRVAFDTMIPETNDLSALDLSKILKTP